jgi:hypothetical protein
MPAVTRPAPPTAPARPALALGPEGPFPDMPLRRVLERRWLHYAFLSRDHELGMVANVAWLGPSPEDPLQRPRCTSILLVHRRGEGWCASQFNAVTRTPLWSAFRHPHPRDLPGRLELASTADRIAVELDLSRTSRPCTSQCAPFAGRHHLRWQSETGVVARGDWRYHDRIFRDVQAIGYHERVRGYWGWPELGGWVFGFVNDPTGTGDRPPATAIVFTLIQPRGPADAATGSVMLWRDGRLRRHFPRRRVSVAVRGQLDANEVLQVPALARTLGVPPMPAIPRRLVIAAEMGADRVVLDFSCEAAARVVIPNETGIDPFSVHEVIGPCRVDGHLGTSDFSFETYGIVEFAGGASDD